MMWKPDLSASDLRWRSELEPDCRPRQFNRIFETLKKTCFKNCALVNLDELNQMAEWIEDEIYSDAISRKDYVYKVYLKILNMKTRFQTTTASRGMQSQVHNKGQSQISLLNQSQARQSQNVQNTIVSVGAQSSASLPPALPSMATQTLVPNPSGQRINMQSGIEQNLVGSSVSQGLPSNIFTNTQWRPGWNQLKKNSSQQQQIMKQNLLQPTQMSNAVGGSTTNTQSEIAHAQYLFQQQQQLLRHQLMNPQLFSSSMNSNAQTGQNAVDWQEEIYQKIRSMKQNYLPYLNEIHYKISIECHQLKSNVSVLNVPQCERQKLLNLLRDHIYFLNLPKNRIVPAMKDMLTVCAETQRSDSVLNVSRCEKQNMFNLLESRLQIRNAPKYINVPAMKDMLSVYEKMVIHVINSNWHGKPFSAQKQIQQPAGHPLSTQPQQQEEEVDNQMQPMKS